MKSSFKLLLAAALMVLAWEGCQNQTPTSYTAANAPNPAMIVDFNASPANWPTPWPTPIPTAQPANGPVTDAAGSNITQYPVNSTLAEANRSGNVVQVPGVMVPTGSPLINPTLFSPGANNTSHCVHMTGTVVDPGNASYPSAQMVIPLDANGNKRYDASLFSGIKFYIKVAASDTAGTRSFSIPIVQTTTTANGGNCDQAPFTATNNPCYNGFAYAYPNTGGAWQLVNLTFLSLARGNYGPAITPSTLSGINLQQILDLQWSEGNQNVAGTANVDFYVDEIQFF